MAEPDEKKNTAYDIFQDFLSTSSLTGAPHLVNNSRIRKCFWLLVLIVMFVGFSSATVISIKKYLANPTIIKSRTKLRGFRYPDVTVCNDKPFIEQPINPANNARYSWSLVLGRMLRYDETSAGNLATRKAIASSRDFVVESNFIMNIDFCLYRGKNCRIHQSGSHNPYGCITIRPDMSEVESSNENQGLILIISPSKGFTIFSGIESVSENSTYKLFFHGEDTAPDMSSVSSSVKLLRGHLHDINIKMNQKTNEKSSCVESRNDSLSDWKTAGMNGNVSFVTDEKLCQELWYQENLFQECGCFDGQKWIPFYATKGMMCSSLTENIYKFGLLTGPPSEVNPTTQWISTIGDETDVSVNNEVRLMTSRTKCQRDFEQKVQSKENPTCSKKICTEQKYSVDTVYEQQKGVLNYPIDNFPFRNVNMSRGELIVQVKVSNLDIIENFEESSYSTCDLMSDIGGQVALWISCSLITVLEFFELFVRLIYLGCKRSFSRSKSATENNPDAVPAEEKA